MYQLELIKTDSDTGLALNDIPFVISKKENSTNYYLKLNADTDTTATDFEWTTTESEAKQFETGKSYFVRDGEFKEREIDAGYIRIGYFESGADFRWKEVSVPAGYDYSGTLEVPLVQ